MGIAFWDNYPLQSIIYEADQSVKQISLVQPFVDFAFDNTQNEIRTFWTRGYDLS